MFGHEVPQKGLKMVYNLRVKCLNDRIPAQREPHAGAPAVYFLPIE